MHLVFRQTSVFHYFSESGNHRADYRRDSLGNWEARFGETWEPMENTADLEVALESWLKEQEAAPALPSSSDPSSFEWPNHQNVVPFSRLMDLPVQRTRY